MSATESVKQMGNSFNGVPLRFGYDRNGKSHIEMLDYNGNAGILISGKRGKSGGQAFKVLLNEMTDSISIVPAEFLQTVFLNFPKSFGKKTESQRLKYLMQETEKRINVLRTSLDISRDRSQLFRQRFVIFLWMDHRISRKMRRWIKVVTSWGTAIKINILAFSSKRFPKWYQKDLFVCFNTYMEFQEMDNESVYTWKMQKVFWVDSALMLSIQGKEKT